MIESISASDWEIMRILWGNPKMTSGEVHKELLHTKKWNITTVKTLISRLLKKGYLHVDKSLRYPRYSCVFTEEECIENEMKHTIYRIYGNTLLHESEYFQFFGNSEMEYVYELDSITDYHYKTICNKIGYDIGKKQQIMIHRSLRNFHSAMGKVDSPDWFRMGKNYGMYHIAPSKCFEDHLLEPFVSFILALVTVDNLHHGLPYYFKQGISISLSSMNLRDMIISSIDEILESINDLRVLDLSIEEDKLGESRQFEIAYLFTTYLTHLFGEDSILDILHDRVKLSSLLVTVQSTFVEDWKKFIIEKYIKGD